MAKRLGSGKQLPSVKALMGAPCPCDSSKAYQTCCEPYHLGFPAPTAEALMRSRYSAYTLGLEPYLLSTWHPDTRPDALHLNEDQAIQWLGLQVKQALTTGTTATVDFVARYKVGGKAYRLCELSQFVCQDDIWYYLQGDQPASN